MDFEDLFYDIRNGVAWIIINRPERVNAFDGKTCDELITAPGRDSPMGEGRAGKRLGPFGGRLQ